MNFILSILAVFSFQFSYAQRTSPPKPLKAAPAQKLVDPTGDRTKCIIGATSDNIISAVTTALTKAESSIQDPKKPSTELCKSINDAKAVVQYLETYIAKPNSCSPNTIAAFRTKLAAEKNKLESDLVKQFNCKADTSRATAAPAAGNGTISSDPVEAVKNELTRAYVAVTTFHKNGGAYPDSLDKASFESANGNVDVTYKKEGSGFLLKATDGNTQMSIDQNKRLVVK